MFSLNLVEEKEILERSDNSDIPGKMLKSYIMMLEQRRQ